MATKTKLLGLSKPDYADNVNVNTLNKNYDVIDNAFSKISQANNLLVNSYFASAINTTGKTVYTGAGHTINKWSLWHDDGQVTLVDGSYIIVDAQYLYQVLPSYKVDVVYTLAVMRADGTITLRSHIFSEGETEEDTDFLISENGEACVRLGASEGSMVWAALYEGEYTVDNLPRYQIKEIKIEMIDCGLSLSPYNLLVNGNFADPVNSSLQSDYYGSGLTIDEWYLTTNDELSTLHIGEGYIIVNRNVADVCILSQRFPLGTFDISNAYTFAVKKLDGSIFINNSSPIVEDTENGYQEVQIQGVDFDGVEIVWAALYKGFYSLDMLSDCVPYPKEVETLRCSVLPESKGGTGVTTAEAYRNKLGLSSVAISGSYNDLSDKPEYATVATSGSYNDLSDTPSLATVATSGSYNDLSDKPSLATVATSGSYNDLTNKPTVSFDPLAAYPVGSLYWSSKSTSPASLFGGTWTQIKDKFILAAGSTYSNGATGGSATVTLTIDQIPSHRHDAKVILPSGESGTAGYGIEKWASGEYGYKAASTNYIGGGGSHNNMPPYIVKYCWERTA